MAVVSCYEIHDGRGGGVSRGDKKDTRKWTRVFRVITNSNYDGPVEILLAATIIPRVGQSHPQDPYAWAKDFKCDQDSKSKLIWTVTVEYTTDRSTPESSDKQNPLTEPAVIEWSTDTTQEDFTKDKNGDAIVNHAKDPFVPPVKGDVSGWTVTVTKNVAFVPTWITDYRDAVNSDAFMLDGYSVAAGTAKMKSIKIGKWQQRNDIWFRELSFTISLRGDWSKVILNTGLNHYDAGKKIRNTLSDGTYTTQPQLLGTDGHLLSSGDTPIWCEFDIYAEQPFSTLPLT